MYFCSARRSGLRSVAAVAAGLIENIFRRVRLEPDLDLLGHQIHVDLLDHQIDDLDQVFVDERSEQNDFIQAVEELGIEGPLHLAHHLIFDFLRNARFVGDSPRSRSGHVYRGNARPDSRS